MSEVIIDNIIKLVIIIVAARIGGYLAEKIKQPAVLGELIVGVLIGPSLFNLIPAEGTDIIKFLAEIGIILLLFDIGIESSVYQLMKVGWSSLFVASIGVVFPFFLGYIFFSMSGSSSIIAIFIGATLTATSVGVTLRVLSDLKKVRSDEGKIIIGAAVIDDVIGLIILSVVGGIAATGKVSAISVGKIVLFSLAFLVGTIWIGIKFEPLFIKFVHWFKIKRTFIISAFVFAMLMSILANKIGLATIVGAFAAGLVIEAAEHKEHIRTRLNSLKNIFVPIFFVMAGVLLDFRTFTEPKTLIIIVILTIIAVVGKILSGLGVVNKGVKRIIVGVGMIPRGEVGLIFASFGLAHNIVDSSMYSALVAMIIITTFITPPLLKKVIEKFG